jgi:HEAT repeat protein
MVKKGAVPQPHLVDNGAPDSVEDIRLAVAFAIADLVQIVSFHGIFRSLAQDGSKPQRIRSGSRIFVACVAD